MARLAGQWTDEGGADGAQDAGNDPVCRAAAGYAARMGWKIRALGKDKVRMACAAPDLADCDEVGGLLIAIDGMFYNGEFPAGRQGESGVFADLYRKHGFEGAVKKVNGDFSIALYDPGTRELWLARDRLGTRPMYYAFKGGRFGFSSRPSFLLRMPGVSPAPRKAFLGIYGGSHYRYIDNDIDRSAYEDILQLPFGSFLRFDGRDCKVGRYWDLEERPDWAEPESVLAEKYRDLFLDAVRLRMRRVDRPAFTLSGGMDSSSVLAATVKLSGKKQIAFSSVYEDKTYDESGEIASMLPGYVDKWIPFSIGTPDVWALVDRMVEAHDEPVLTATWLSHFLLSEEVAKQGYKTLFGGLGGDELNAGEYEHFFPFFADLMKAGRTADLSAEVAMWVKYHDHPIFKKDYGVMEATVKRTADLSRQGICLPDRVRLERYASAMNRDYFDLKAFQPIMDHPFQSYLKNRLYQDMTRETIPCCLRAEDRQTAAFGLENCTPFFDHRLVEFMYRVPGDMKIRKGVTKHLLREAMTGVLPEETRTRTKKVGWNAPAHKWFSGAGLERLKDMVHDKRFKERGIYDIKEVTRLLNEHEDIVANGKAIDNHMMFFWQLVNMETWLRRLDAGA
ncbi:MAG: Asparagine synthase [Fibrobacteres bacterium]|nr:Asparagine synthase [Fibrobacterota bacterium]